MNKTISASLSIAALTVAMTALPAQAGLLDTVGSVVESVVSVESGDAGSGSAVNVGLGGGDSGSNNVVEVSLGGSSTQSSGGGVQVSSGGSSGVATASISTGSSQAPAVTASVLSPDSVARVNVGTRAAGANVVIGSPVTTVSVNIPGTTPRPGVDSNNIKLGSLLPENTVLKVPNPNNPRETISLSKQDLANLVVECGGLDPRRMTQMFDRSAPSQWGNARSAEVVSVATCEIGQAIVANHLNTDEKYSNFLNSLDDYPHILSALQSGNHGLGDVFAITKSGNGLKIYVY